MNSELWAQVVGKLSSGATNRATARVIGVTVGQVAGVRHRVFGHSLTRSEALALPKTPHGGHNKGVRSPRTLALESEIISFVESHPGATGRDVTRALKLPKRRIANFICRLVTEGAIIQEGRTSGARYRVAA